MYLILFLYVAGHLHSGNIILEEGGCRILDIENWLLGIPSYYRSFYTQFKKINVSMRVTLSNTPS